MQKDYFNSLDNFLDYTEKRKHQWDFFVDVATFVLVGLIAYWFVNVPAMKVRVVYLVWKPSVANNSEPVSATGQDNKIISDSDNSDDTPVLENATSLSEGIHIDKINVLAPITWNANSDSVSADLEKGAVHIGGTANPGTPGNTFITGHSSDFWWRPGDYKTVFALLDKLENGDETQIVYNKNLFKYKVYNKQVISTDEVAQFVESDRPETLTLMTCYPVGTNWKRLIVQAERVAN